MKLIYIVHIEQAISVSSLSYSVPQCFLCVVTAKASFSWYDQEGAFSQSCMLSTARLFENYVFDGYIKFHRIHICWKKVCSNI
jgi:hypothetical protein